MEIISCHATHHCYIVDFSGANPLSVQRSKLPKLKREKRLFCFLFESRPASLRYPRPDSLRLERLHQRRSSGRVFSHDKYINVGSSVINETCTSYLLDGEEGGSSGTDGAHSIPKVSIPGLPNEENGDNVASISSHFWEWKPKLIVHYDISGSENTDSPPVLFLPGFGVGSFHYEKQLKDLGQDYRVWALDFLGQGLSLPIEDPTVQSQNVEKGSFDGETNVWGFGDESKTWAKELAFSVDLWRDQVRYFIEEVSETFWMISFFLT